MQGVLPLALFLYVIVQKALTADSKFHTPPLRLLEYCQTATALHIREASTFNSSCHNFESGQNIITCDGSLNRPFPNLLEALEFIHQRKTPLSESCKIDLVFTLLNNTVSQLDVDRIKSRRRESGQVTGPGTGNSSALSFDFSLADLRKTPMTVRPQELPRCNIFIASFGFYINASSGLEFRGVFLQDRSNSSLSSVQGCFICSMLGRSKLAFRNFTLISQRTGASAASSNFLSFLRVQNNGGETEVYFESCVINITDSTNFLSVLALEDGTENRLIIKSSDVIVNLTDSEKNKTFVSSFGGFLSVDGTSIKIVTKSKVSNFTLIEVLGSAGCVFLTNSVVFLDISTSSNHKKILLGINTASTLKIRNSSISASIGSMNSNLSLIEAFSSNTIEISDSVFCNFTKKAASVSGLSVKLISLSSNNTLLLLRTILKDFLVPNVTFLSAEIMNSVLFEALALINFERNCAFLRAESLNFVKFQNSLFSNLSFSPSSNLTENLTTFGSNNTFVGENSTIRFGRAVRVAAFGASNCFELRNVKISDWLNIFENGSLALVFGNSNSIILNSCLFFNITTLMPSATALTNCKNRKLCFGGAFFIQARRNSFLSKGSQFVSLSTPDGGLLNFFGTNDSDASFDSGSFVDFFGGFRGGVFYAENSSYLTLIFQNQTFLGMGVQGDGYVASFYRCRGALISIDQSLVQNTANTTISMDTSLGMEVYISRTIVDIINSTKAAVLYYSQNSYKFFVSSEWEIRVNFSDVKILRNKEILKAVDIDQTYNQGNQVLFERLQLIGANLEQIQTGPFYCSWGLISLFSLRSSLFMNFSTKNQGIIALFDAVNGKVEFVNISMTRGFSIVESAFLSMGRCQQTEITITRGLFNELWSDSSTLFFFNDMGFTLKVAKTMQLNTGFDKSGAIGIIQSCYNSSFIVRESFFSDLKKGSQNFVSFSFSNLILVTRVQEGMGVLVLKSYNCSIIILDSAFQNVFSNATDGNGGVLIYLNDGNLRGNNSIFLANCSFKSIEIYGRGGLVYLNNQINTSVILKNCSADQILTESGGEGGILCAELSNSTVIKLIDSEFRNIRSYAGMLLKFERTYSLSVFLKNIECNHSTSFLSGILYVALGKFDALCIKGSVFNNLSASSVFIILNNINEASEFVFENNSFLLCNYSILKSFTPLPKNRIRVINNFVDQLKFNIFEISLTQGAVIIENLTITLDRDFQQSYALSLTNRMVESSLSISNITIDSNGFEEKGKFVYLDVIFYFAGRKNVIKIDRLVLGSFQGFEIGYGVLSANMEEQVSIANILDFQLSKKFTKSFLETFETNTNEVIRLFLANVSLTAFSSFYRQGLIVLACPAALDLRNSQFSLSESWSSGLLLALSPRYFKQNVSLTKLTICSIKEEVSSPVHAYNSQETLALIDLQAQANLSLTDCKFGFRSRALNHLIRVRRPSELRISRSSFFNIFLKESAKSPNSIVHISLSSDSLALAGAEISENTFLNCKETLFTLEAPNSFSLEKKFRFSSNNIVKNKAKYVFALSGIDDGKNDFLLFFALNKNNFNMNDRRVPLLWYSNIMNENFINKLNRLLNSNLSLKFSPRSPLYSLSLSHQRTLDLLDEVADPEKKLQLLAEVVDNRYQVTNKQIQGDCFFYIVPLDYLGNVLYSEMSEKDVQNFISSSQIAISYKIRKGLLCASNITILNGYQPQETVKYEYFFKTNFKEQSQMSPKQENWPIFIDFNSCQEGQILDSESLVCKNCPRGTFARGKVLRDFNIECQYCYSNFDFYCYGANKISPKAGFWRGVNNSMTIMKCPGDACLGDIYFEVKEQSLSFQGVLGQLYSQDPDLDTEAFVHGVCSVGYAGELCTKCEGDYGAIENFKCVPCKDWQYYLKFVLLLIIKLIIYIMAVIKILSTNKSLIKSQERESFIAQNVKSSKLLTIVGTHFQILSLIRFLPLNLSLQLKDLFSLGGQTLSQNLDHLFSQECLLKQMGLSDYMPIQYSVLTSLFVFDLFCFILIFYYWYYSLNKKLSSSHKIGFCDTLKKTGAIILVYLLIVNQPGQVQPFINQFICVDILEPQPNAEPSFVSHLFLEMNIVCDEHVHSKIKYFLSLPLIVALVIVLPLYLVVILIFRRSELESPKMLFRFGFLYHPFRSEVTYYNIIEFLRNDFLIIFQTGFLLSGVHSEQLHRKLALFLLLFLSIYHLAFLKLKPYKSAYTLITKMTKFSSLCLIFTLFIALIWISDEDSNTTALGILLWTLVLIFHAFFLAMVIVQYSKFLKEKIPRYRRSIKSFIERTKALFRNSFRGNKKLDDFFQNLTSLISSQNIESSKAAEIERDPRLDKLLLILKNKVNSQKQKKKLWRTKCELLSQHMEILYRGQANAYNQPAVGGDPTNDQDFQPFEHLEEVKHQVMEIDLQINNGSSLSCRNDLSPLSAPSSQSKCITASIFRDSVEDARPNKRLLSEGGELRVFLESKYLVGDNLKDYYMCVVISIATHDSIELDLERQQAPIISSVKVCKELSSNYYLFTIANINVQEIHNLKDPLIVEIWARVAFNPLSVKEFSLFNDPQIALSFDLGKKPTSLAFPLPLRINDFCKLVWDPTQYQQLDEAEFDLLVARAPRTVKEVTHWGKKQEGILTIDENLKDFSIELSVLSPVVTSSFNFTYVSYQEKRFLLLKGHQKSKNQLCNLKIFEQLIVS